ncbi:unnamed protein product [Calicophoron daubneyi]|uniref:RRP15-like protein n=1 Tax=Calicophoron daubneyi TaxID=300641 RepID=A0AAV2TIZ6_CALDB
MRKFMIPGAGSVNKQEEDGDQEQEGQQRRGSGGKKWNILKNGVMWANKLRTAVQKKHQPVEKSTTPTKPSMLISVTEAVMRKKNRDDHLTHCTSLKEERI